jgi:hypothetical protein
MSVSLCPVDHQDTLGVELCPSLELSIEFLAVPFKFLHPVVKLSLNVK